MHPRKREVLTRNSASVLSDLRSGLIDTLAGAADSRPIHRRLFHELTPPGHEYYAGNYRGEDYRCLRYLNVMIPGDPQVGFPSNWVLGYVREIAGLIRGGISALDLARQVPDGQLPREQKVLYVVIFACRIFELFLRVHPYADGNGHAARFIVWAILGRYGYWPKRWPLDPRPPDPPYSELIRQYRSGNRERLEAYILSTLS